VQAAVVWIAAVTKGGCTVTMSYCRATAVLQHAIGSHLHLWQHALHWRGVGTWLQTAWLGTLPVPGQ
jgi:hypothetical protein